MIILSAYIDLLELIEVVFLTFKFYIDVVANEAASSPAESSAPP